MSDNQPIKWELDFDDTELKELEKKLFSGEITFEEWEKALQEHVDSILSKLD
ncbi:MAG: hypothetical protein IJ104_04100 [Methanobrevibacter sp.]|nr:hypothetical protein [Methanobrevibacter sp.]